MLAWVDSSHGRGSCVLWMPLGGCHRGRGCYQNPMGTGWKGNFQEGKGQFPKVRQGEAASWVGGYSWSKDPGRADSKLCGQSSLCGFNCTSLGRPQHCLDSQRVRDPEKATAHLLVQSKSSSWQLDDFNVIFSSESTGPACQGDLFPMPVPPFSSCTRR